ncbi:MAG: ATP synthase F1 subunit delta [Gemmatales bacterium]|nr:ATP synthase F1 subunit delta [Gemmatales bacterium]MDW8221780.1 ATP synthase F1 subunit delta [Gemmatales bacterium]
MSEHSQPSHTYPQPRTVDRPLYPTVLDIKGEQIARAYAEALLKAARGQQAEDEVLEQLNSLIEDVLGSSPELELFLSSGSISRRRKAEMIRKLFEGRAHPLVVHFLLVLNDHDRLNLLRTTVRAYQQLRDREARRLRVEIRSAVPLGEGYLERIAGQLREIFHIEPQVTNRVQPELLGGLVVRLGDWVFDGSVRSHLDKFRKELLSRAAHAIQTQRDRFSTASGD